jgi:SdrD B-like domain
LPAGFAFTSGSAMIHIIGSNGEETDARAITPIVNSDSLVFSIGSLAAGGKVLIRYSAVVRSDAHAGEHRSGVVGIANLRSGKRVNSSPAQVRLMVTQGAFTLNQVLIGRVFEDRDRNGSYDSGETGVANVRVVTSSGQTATTDSDGLYSLPSLTAGSVLVALDPSTLPPGFTPPPNESRLGGAGQLLRTPLEGGGLLRQNFALIRAASSVPTIPNVSSLTEQTDTGFGDDAARLQFIIDRPVMAAGAYDRQLIRIRVFGNPGQRERANHVPILVSTSSGAVMAASKMSDSNACESVLSLDPRPDLSRQVSLDVEDGEAVVCLVSDVVPSTTHLTASSGARQLSATADVRFESSQHPPLLVAAGEIGIGLSGPGKNATDGARRVDGLVSMFYQQSLTKKDLLSVAVRSKGSVNGASGNNGLFEFDPTQRIYPVIGDASTRQELGQSASRVYARYDRGRSYVMYGDLHGDSGSESRSGLLEYNRNVTGFRLQIQTTDPTKWLQAQVARPNTGYMREISSALSGSAIRLSRLQILPGSETITLEVRDRRNPELILSRETLVRNVDYSLDPASGIVFMMRSVSLFDPSLNLVQLVSTYEYQTTGIDSAVYLGRGSYEVNPVGLRLGVSMLSQSEGGMNFSVGGLELEQKLWNGGRFHAELPISHGQLASDASSSGLVNRDGKAIRAELEQPLGLRNTVLHGRYARTDEGFFNPYGATTVQGVQSRGASVETRGFGTSILSFGIEQEVNRNSAVDNQRQTISAKLTETLTENLSLETGIDRRAFEDHASGRQIDSELISAGLKWKPLSRLETSLRREQNLGEADPTYPSQTLLGAQYKLSATSRIFATQRFSSAPITPIGGAETIGVLSPQSTRETAIGVESRLHGNTNLTTNYRMDTSERGSDSFAVIGVLTRLPVRPGLSFDWTLDNAVHLAGAGKGYVGGSFGFTKSKDDTLRMFTRYEMRRGDTTQGIFTAGIVGRLSTATSAMARYRVANNTAGTVGRINDGQVALAVRPKKSDRVALLFSYDFGNGNAMATAPVSLANPGRTDRLSADSLIQIAHGFEFYSRVAEARTPGLYVGSRLGTYIQGRLQKSLTRRFDIAGEARWIRESVIVRGSLITGIEWGTWITRDFRIGLGYSSRGFANPGSLLDSTAARGGPYLIMSSKLSSIFDLMGVSGKTN